MNADESLRKVLLRVFQARFKTAEQCPNEHPQCIVCALGKMPPEECQAYLSEMTLEDLELIYCITPCIEEFKPANDHCLERFSVKKMIESSTANK